MAAIDPSRYNELCRLCAATTTMILAVHIFQNDGIITQLRKKIESCLSIQVHESDELPKMVCENCIYKLNLLAEFKEKTMLTEKMLLNLLKNINAGKIEPNQQTMDVVTIDHDLIMAQNQQLLVNHGMGVDEIDLGQLSSREQLIVEHEIILTHQNVDMNGHTLENINLNHHELASQDISNHSLPTQDTILVESSSAHDIESARFGNDNLDLIPHQQLLNGQFRLQHELHVNMVDENAVDEIALAGSLDGSVVHSKMDENLQHDRHSFHLPDEKDYHNSTSRRTNARVNEMIKLESPKLEGSNSNNSLLINEQLSRVDASNHVYTTENDVCTDLYKGEENFTVRYGARFHKCNVCFSVFPNEEVLNAHRKEAHAHTEERRIDENVHETNSYHLHDDKTYRSSISSSVNARMNEMVKLESPKLEDSNSNNSLLIDEQNRVDTSNHIYTTNSNVCTDFYKDDENFDMPYGTSFHKCDVCFAVFPNDEVLNVHRKEAHAHTEQRKPVKTRLKRATLPIKRRTNGESNSDDSGGDFADDQEQTEEENEDNAEVVTPEKSTSKKKIWSPKVCKECGKSYKTNYKLNEHMRKHTGEKPYKCDNCEKEFRSKIGLAQHAAKHTGKYDYACPICGKGFQCKSYLMVHQRVHSDEKPYPCVTCGRNFKTKQSLLDHTNRHLGVKPYTCDICGRGFITKGLCKAHQKVHTGLDNRKYSCKVCNKMFVSKSYLQTHLRIHTGEKPFICEVCGKGFLTKVDLRIHTTMHTGEKSYVCEMCGKAFARRDALRCHRRSHTGERPYSCDLCGQTFTQFTPMAIHKRLHTGERPYACESCGKTFISRSTMMSHAKKHR